MAPVSRQKAQRGEHLWLINEVADQHSHVKGIDPTITTREIVAFLRPREQVKTTTGCGVHPAPVGRPRRAHDRAGCRR